MAMSDELEQRCLAAALARARDTCSRLGDDSQVRSKMEAFLDVLAPMLQLDRTHRGHRPSMKNSGLRRRVADDLPVGHPLKASRAAAFDRVEELLQEGWPRLSRTECRQKSQRLMDSEGARAPSQHTFPRTRSRTNFHARAHAQFSVPQMRRLQRLCSAPLVIVSSFSDVSAVGRASSGVGTDGPSTDQPFLSKGTAGRHAN